MLYFLSPEFNSTCGSSAWFQMYWLNGTIQYCNITPYPYASGNLTGSISWIIIVLVFNIFSMSAKAEET